MKLEQATLQYWKMSQHMVALPPSEREAFLVLVIGPASVKNPILTRLTMRGDVAASA